MVQKGELLMNIHSHQRTHLHHTKSQKGHNQQLLVLPGYPLLGGDDLPI